MFNIVWVNHYFFFFSKNIILVKRLNSHNNGKCVSCQYISNIKALSCPISHAVLLIFKFTKSNLIQRIASYLFCIRFNTSNDLLAIFKFVSGVRFWHNMFAIKLFSMPPEPVAYFSRS